jgi:hypothetical protein
MQGLSTSEHLLDVGIRKAEFVGNGSRHEARPAESDDEVDGDALWPPLAAIKDGHPPSDFVDFGGNFPRAAHASASSIARALFAARSLCARVSGFRFRGWVDPFGSTPYIDAICEIDGSLPNFVRCLRRASGVGASGCCLRQNAASSCLASFCLVSSVGVMSPFCWFDFPGRRALPTMERKIGF